MACASHQLVDIGSIINIRVPNSGQWGFIHCDKKVDFYDHWEQNLLIFQSTLLANMLFVVDHTILVTRMQYLCVCCPFRLAKCVFFPRTKLGRNIATGVAVRYADKNMAFLSSVAVKNRFYLISKHCPVTGLSMFPYRYNNYMHIDTYYVFCPA